MDPDIKMTFWPNRERLRFLPTPLSTWRTFSILLVTGLILALHPAGPLAGEEGPGSIHAENDRYRVELKGPGEPRFDPSVGGRVRFTFSVMDKAGNREFPIFLDNITSKINHIRLSEEMIIVFGEEATLHSSVTTLINLEDQKEKDAIMGFGNTLSETGRYIVYRKFFHPDSAEPARMSDLVLIYDLWESSDTNRMKGKEVYRNDPIGLLTEVGYPVYPEDKAGKKNYRIWVRDEKRRHSIIPDGFFWLDEDRRVAFADRVGGENYLVVVDITTGLESPVLNRTWIDPRSLVRLEDSGGELVGDYIQELRLEDIQSIENGSIRIHVLSDYPPQEYELEFTEEELKSGLSYQESSSR